MVINIMGVLGGSGGMFFLIYGFRRFFGKDDILLRFDGLMSKF